MAVTPRSPGRGCGTAATGHRSSRPAGLTSVQLCDLPRAPRRERAGVVPRQVVDHGAADRLQLLPPRRVQPRDRAQQPMRVGVARRAEEPVPLRALDDPSAVEHVDGLAQPGDDAEVVRDHDQGRARLPHELGQQPEDLRLDRDVEGGGRFVGDEQPRLAGEGDRDEGALAHAAGELVGVGVEPAPRVGDAHPLQQLGRSLAGLVARHPPVPAQHLGDLQADRDHGVERRERVLEHHRQVAAAALAHLRLGQRQQIRAVHPHRSGDPHPARRQQPHDRQRRHGLAAAGLPDEADHLTGSDVEAHAVDGDVSGSRRRVKATCRSRTSSSASLHRRPLGSRASRSDSPRSVKPSATTMIAAAGKKASAGRTSR